MEEDVPNDHLLLPLNLVSSGTLLLQELMQLRREVEHAPLAILRRAWIEPDLSDAKIDLPPLERQHLAVDPPPGDVREGHDRPHALRQVCKHGLVLLPLEETDADIVLPEAG